MEVSRAFGPLMSALFVTEIHTGLRPQELLHLTWEDIRFDKRSLMVRGRWEREVPLASAVTDALEVLRDTSLTLPQYHVFGNPDGSMMSHASLRNRVRKAVLTAGLPKITLLALRRFFVVSLVRKGVGLDAARHIIGRTASCLRLGTWNVNIPPDTLAIRDTLGPQ